MTRNHSSHAEIIAPARRPSSRISRPKAAALRAVLDEDASGAKLAAVHQWLTMPVRRQQISSRLSATQAARKCVTREKAGFPEELVSGP